MAVREYIGARYVPAFADPIEWDASKAYEALTVVTYNGFSYTSKCDVPSGVDIGNADYWVQSGDYNGQVQSCIDTVATFDERITALEHEEILIDDVSCDIDNDFDTLWVTLSDGQVMRMQHTADGVPVTYALTSSSTASIGFYTWILRLRGDVDDDGKESEDLSTLGLYKSGGLSVSESGVSEMSAPYELKIYSIIYD